MGDFLIAAHYETENYISPKTQFLEDVEYGRALDTLVKACADVILTDGELGKVLILKRVVQPLDDWWCVGGRMQAGETPAEAAARNVLRELKIDISPDRFKYLCHASLLWQFRHQEPKGNGTADVALTFTAELSPEERQAISFDTAEYEAAKWVDPATIIQDASFHTALRRSMQHIVIRKRCEDLHAAIEAAATDVDIAKLARVAYQAKKVLIDIERRPHAKVRSYGSSEERELLVKAAEAAQTAASLSSGPGLGAWIYRSLGIAS
ncbi:g9507 [Coccomyxa elongata]